MDKTADHGFWDIALASAKAGQMVSLRFLRTNAQTVRFRSSAGSNHGVLPPTGHSYETRPPEEAYPHEDPGQRPTACFWFRGDKDW